MIGDFSSSVLINEILSTSHKIDFDFLAKLNLSINLLFDFRNEIEEKKEFIKGKENLYKQTFDYVAQAILPLKPIKIDAKITVNDSIYIKFLLDNKYWIRLEIFLDDIQHLDPKQTKVVLSIDEGDEQIFGTYCNIDDAISFLFEQVGNLISKINFPDTSEHISSVSTTSTEENASLSTGFID